MSTWSCCFAKPGSRGSRMSHQGTGCPTLRDFQSVGIPADVAPKTGPGTGRTRSSRGHAPGPRALSTTVKQLRNDFLMTNNFTTSNLDRGDLSLAQTDSMRDRLFQRPASGTLTAETRRASPKSLLGNILRVLGDIRPEQLPQNQYVKGSAAKNMGINGVYMTRF